MDSYGKPNFEDFPKETIKEKVARWRQTASSCRQTVKECGHISGPGNSALRVRAETLEECATELEQAETAFLLCPTPELKGHYGVVLFFKDEADSRELVDAVKQTKPDMIEKPL